MLKSGKKSWLFSGAVTKYSIFFFLAQGEDVFRFFHLSLTNDDDNGHDPIEYCNGGRNVLDTTCTIFAFSTAVDEEHGHFVDTDILYCRLGQACRRSLRLQLLFLVQELRRRLVFQ